MFDEKVFDITFIDAVFNDEQEKMVKEFEEMFDIHGATRALTELFWRG